MIFFIASLIPVSSLNSGALEVNKRVPPLDKIPPTSLESRLINSPFIRPKKPLFIPITSFPSKIAVLVIALMAAFIPGASPPDVKIAIGPAIEQGFYYELNISKSDISENALSENDREGYQKVIEGVSKSDREKPETLSKNDSTKESINKLSKENIKKAKFEKPDFQTVDQYIIEKKYNVDSRMFFDFYNEADWIDSKGKQVRSWKQKVITWHNRNKTNSFKPQEKSYREQLDERYPLI